jgi:hypothetical protein
MHTGQELQPIYPFKIGVNYEREDGLTFAVIPPYARTYKRGDEHTGQVILLDGTITPFLWRPSEVRERPGLLKRLWEAVFGKKFAPLTPKPKEEPSVKVEVLS